MKWVECVKIKDYKPFYVYYNEKHNEDFGIFVYVNKQSQFKSGLRDFVYSSLKLTRNGGRRSAYTIPHKCNVGYK